MRKIILSLSAALLASTPVWAINCQVETDCTTLGYTETKDEGGCLKCPFGNQWACVKSAGQEEPSTGKCQIGAILYSDMTCSSEVISSKTPIGVVFDSDRKLAIGLETSKLAWSSSYDIPNLTNYNSTSVAVENWSGKENTKIAWEYCQYKKDTCPAFEYVSNYKREGTSAGDWYLPAAAELNAIYKNKEVLNTTLGKIGGTKLPVDETYWSSSENSSSNAWCQYFRNATSASGDIYYSTKYSYDGYYVRPVIAFPVSAAEEPDTTPTPDYSNCTVGAILNSDKTCSSEIVSGKTPIGVVFHAERRLAIALSGGRDRWAAGNIDVPELNNYDVAGYAFIEDWSGKENTKIAWEYCKANDYDCPAFEYVMNYKREGTSAGDWYIPAAAELKAIEENADILNTTLAQNKLPSFLSGSFWSSTESHSGYAWTLGFTTDEPIPSPTRKSTVLELVPILAF